MAIYKLLTNNILVIIKNMYNETKQCSGLLIIPNVTSLEGDNFFLSLRICT